MAIHGRRLVGYLRPPTRDQVAKYARHRRLDLASEDFEEQISSVGAWIRLFDRLDEIAEPNVAWRHPYRDPGRAPNELEDPWNAIIRFCDISGADAGPLTGKRLGIKDCIAVAGLPMTVGGRRMPTIFPTEDAVVIRRLLDAGATIAAKTNMEDMAVGHGESSAFGVVRNPHNPSFVTGGSSSGSGAAVAGGMVDAALGSDTGGSIRIPSAWCGIVGMKPTFGLVPSQGLTHLTHTMDHIGPMTTTVADNALLLEVMVGEEIGDPRSVEAEPIAADYQAAAGTGIKGLRVGVIEESLEPSGCTDANLKAFRDAQEVLSNLGAEVVPVSVPLWTDAASIWLALLSFEWAAMLDSFGQGYGHLRRVDVNVMATTAAQWCGGRHVPSVVQTILLTVEHLRESYQGVHFGLAQNLRLELRRQIDQLFRDVDLVATPTTPVGPFEVPEVALTEVEIASRGGIAPALNTCPLNVTGHPALSMPSGPGDHGLPTGLQVIGRRFEEQTVYRAGFAFEEGSLHC